MENEARGVPRIAKAFARGLRRARVRAGVSQVALARMIGVKRGFITHIEKGERNISLGTADKAARGLGTSVVAILAEMEIDRSKKLRRMLNLVLDGRLPVPKVDRLPPGRKKGRVRRAR